MTNKKKLWASMVLFGDNFSSLADAMHVAKSTLSHKANNKVQFTPEEINFIRHRYDLSPEQVVDIFLE